MNNQRDRMPRNRASYQTPSAERIKFEKREKKNSYRAVKPITQFSFGLKSDASQRLPNSLYAGPSRAAHRNASPMATALFSQLTAGSRRDGTPLGTSISTEPAQQSSHSGMHSQQGNHSGTHSQQGNHSGTHSQPGSHIVGHFGSHSGPAHHGSHSGPAHHGSQSGPAYRVSRAPNSSQMHAQPGSSSGGPVQHSSQSGGSSQHTVHIQGPPQYSSNTGGPAQFISHINFKHSHTDHPRSSHTDTDKPETSSVSQRPKDDIIISLAHSSILQHNLQDKSENELQSIQIPRLSMRCLGESHSQSKPGTPSVKYLGETPSQLKQSESRGDLRAVSTVSIAAQLGLGRPKDDKPLRKGVRSGAPASKSRQGQHDNQFSPDTPDGTRIIVKRPDSDTLDTTKSDNGGFGRSTSTNKSSAEEGYKRTDSARLIVASAEGLAIGSDANLTRQRSGSGIRTTYSPHSMRDLSSSHTASHQPIQSQQMTVPIKVMRSSSIGISQGVQLWRDRRASHVSRADLARNKFPTLHQRHMSQGKKHSSDRMLYSTSSKDRKADSAKARHEQLKGLEAGVELPTITPKASWTDTTALLQLNIENREDKMQKPYVKNINAEALIPDAAKTSVMLGKNKRGPSSKSRSPESAKKRDGTEVGVNLSGIPTLPARNTGTLLKYAKIQVERQPTVEDETERDALGLASQQLSFMHKQKLSVSKISALYMDYNTAPTVLRQHREATAAPIFHCAACLQHWLTYGQLRTSCDMLAHPTAGPIMPISLIPEGLFPQHSAIGMMDVLPPSPVDSDRKTQSEPTDSCGSPPCPDEDIDDTKVPRKVTTRLTKTTGSGDSKKSAQHKHARSPAGARGTHGEAGYRMGSVYSSTGTSQDATHRGSMAHNRSSPPSARQSDTVAMKVINVSDPFGKAQKKPLLFSAKRGGTTKSTRKGSKDLSSDGDSDRHSGYETDNGDDTDDEYNDNRQKRFKPKSLKERMKDEVERVQRETLKQQQESMDEKSKAKERQMQERRANLERTIRIAYEGLISKEELEKKIKAAIKADEEDMKLKQASSRMTGESYDILGSLHRVDSYELANIKGRHEKKMMEVEKEELHQRTFVWSSGTASVKSSSSWEEIPCTADGTPIASVANTRPGSRTGSRASDVTNQRARFSKGRQSTLGRSKMRSISRDSTGDTDIEKGAGSRLSLQSTAMSDKGPDDPGSHPVSRGTDDSPETKDGTASGSSKRKSKGGKKRGSRVDGIKGLSPEGAGDKHTKRRGTLSKTKKKEDGEGEDEKEKEKCEPVVKEKKKKKKFKKNLTVEEAKAQSFEELDSKYSFKQVMEDEDVSQYELYEKHGTRFTPVKSPYKIMTLVNDGSPSGYSPLQADQAKTDEELEATPKYKNVGRVKNKPPKIEKEKKRALIPREGKAQHTPTKKRATALWRKVVEKFEKNGVLYERIGKQIQRMHSKDHIADESPFIDPPPDPHDKHHPGGKKRKSMLHKDHDDYDKISEADEAKSATSKDLSSIDQPAGGEAVTTPRVTTSAKSKSRMAIRVHSPVPGSEQNFAASSEGDPSQSQVTQDQSSKTDSTKDDGSLTGLPKNSVRKSTKKARVDPKQVRRPSKVLTGVLVPRQPLFTGQSGQPARDREGGRDREGARDREGDREDMKTLMPSQSKIARRSMHSPSTSNRSVRGSDMSSDEEPELSFNLVPSDVEPDECYSFIKIEDDITVSEMESEAEGEGGDVHLGGPMLGRRKALGMKLKPRTTNMPTPLPVPRLPSPAPSFIFPDEPIINSVASLPRLAPRTPPEPRRPSIAPRRPSMRRFMAMPDSFENVSLFPPPKVEKPPEPPVRGAGLRTLDNVLGKLKVGRMVATMGRMPIAPAQTKEEKKPFIPPPADELTILDFTPAFTYTFYTIVPGFKEQQEMIKGGKPLIKYRPEKRTAFQRMDSSIEQTGVSKMAEKVHANLAKRSAIRCRCSSSLRGSRSELSIRKYTNDGAGDSKENVLTTCSIARPYASSVNEEARNVLAPEIVIAASSEGVIVHDIN